jgi:hypothetical protein
MTAEPHVVDGQAVEEGPGTELEPVAQHPPTTLFRTDDPVEVVARASKVADALKGVLDRQGLTANIQGKRHVLVEGWTTLGAMVGVTAVPMWTRPLDGAAPDGKSFGFEARVEARTLDGRVIGAAEAMCTRSEGRWRTADDYAIRSMAQTRATSKALRGPLGFVVTLAGYQATPAEEMPRDEPAPAQTPRIAPGAAAELAAAARAGIDGGTVDGARLKLRLVDLGATTTSSLSDAISSLPPEAEAALRAELAPAEAAS